MSGGVLILRDVVFADTAVYQCEATNKHGSALLNTFLHVVGKYRTSLTFGPTCCRVDWCGLVRTGVDWCGLCVRTAPSDSDLRRAAVQSH